MRYTQRVQESANCKLRLDIKRDGSLNFPLPKPKYAEPALETHFRNISATSDNLKCSGTGIDERVELGIRKAWGMSARIYGEQSNSLCSESCPGSKH